MLIYNGLRLPTSHSVAEISKGVRLTTDLGLLFNGMRLVTPLHTEIMNGIRLNVQPQAAITNYLYSYLPTVTNWNAAPPFSGSSGSVDSPFIEPDVYVTMILVTTPTATTVTSVDTVFPGGAPTGDTTTTTTAAGGTTTVTTRVNNIVTNVTTTTTRNTGATTTHDISAYLKTLDLDMPLGGKYSFSCILHQHSVTLDSDGLPSQSDFQSLLSVFPGDMNPLYFGTGSFANSIIHHKFDLSRQVFFTVHVGKYGQYQSWNSPPFASGTPKFDGYELHWSGEDISVILEQEEMVMDDITARSTKTYMAHQTINDITRNYGLTNLISIQFPDYQIRQLRRRGKPIDWIDHICKVHQAQRHWENGKLVFKETLNPDLVSPKFTITAQMITEGSVSVEESDGWFNWFTVSRNEDNGGFYGKQECTGGHCIGRTMNITFDSPLSQANLVLSTTGPAYLTDFVWFNGDKIVGGGPGTNVRYDGGGGPATSVKGTFQLSQDANTGNITQTAGFTQITPYVSDYGYKVNVKGGVTSTNNFSNHFNYTQSDAASISLFGLRKGQKIEDEIIPNAIIAQVYLKAVLNFNTRKIFKQELSTVFINCQIFPGDCVRTDDWLTTRSTPRNWTVEKVRLSMNEAGHWTQKLEMSRGLIT